MRHVKSLDSLRGALSLFVVAAHSWQIFSYPYTGVSSANIVFGFPARAAVLCFFCLSGFVIAMSIHTNIGKNGRFDAVEYTLSRIGRIAPPFLGVVALTFVFWLILDSVGAAQQVRASAARPQFVVDPLSQVVSLLTLTIFGDLTGKLLNGPVWSLVFEIQLYAIAALVTLACFARGQRRALIVLLLLAYVCVFGIVGLKLRTLTYVAFGMGVVSYLLRGIGRRTLAALLCASLPPAVFLGSFARTESIERLDGSFTWIAFQVAVSAFFALLVLAVSRVHWSFQVTRYSYTLYILHFPLFLFAYFLAFRFWPQPLEQWSSWVAIASVPLALLASEVVGRLEHVRAGSLRTLHSQVRARWTTQPPRTPEEIDMAPARPDPSGASNDHIGREGMA